MRFLCCFGSNAIVAVCDRCDATVAHMRNEFRREISDLKTKLNAATKANIVLISRIESAERREAALKEKYADLSCKRAEQRRAVEAFVQNDELRGKLADVTRDLECVTEINHTLHEMVSDYSMDNAKLRDDLEKSLKYTSDDAFEKKAEDIIRQCTVATDDIVAKMKDAVAIESAYPRVHKCPVCQELKGTNWFSMRQCGHGVCTSCVGEFMIEVPQCELCRADAYGGIPLFTQLFLQ